jgi:hypothetical protein
MKKISSGILVLALALMMNKPADAAFVVGGENGWQLSTDGIVDVFATYQTASPFPGGTAVVNGKDVATHTFSLLNGNSTDFQHFSVQVGLLPSVVGLNIKAPTTNGIDSTVRIGIYPSIQNSSDNGNTNRFDTSPNVDFREIYYTAKGRFGELLAGRALNLYQGKAILNDMTLLTAGTVPAPGTTTTLGHIGYGYLYTNFGPQLRYTTPDLNGVKVAVSVNEPYQISNGFNGTDKTPSPRLETEISYATVLSDGTALQAWGSALYQNATMSTGHHVHSVGGDLGAKVVVKGLELSGTGYYGEGLGMISCQDGTFGGGTDNLGNEREHFGFLGQITYQLTSSVKIGANYGQTRQNQTDYDKTNGLNANGIQMKKQESAVAMVAYNLNKFTQFIAEYSYAQNTWQDSATQHSNNFNLGTMFYW